MLTSAQSIVHYDFFRREIRPDRLSRQAHAHYLRAAASMLAIYRNGSGEIRQNLHRRVETVLDRLGDCPPRRAAAFCKLLDDASTYRDNRRNAASLRRRVFQAAAPLHPLVSRSEGMFEHTVADARKQIAEQLGCDWETVEANLFADVIELQSLQSFVWQDDRGNELGPSDLLAAYNVGQVQAALYRAVSLTVLARQDLKTVVRHAKLAGLMHRITRIEDDPERPRYRFQFDGPASALRQTWRYGVRFATFIPKLLTCREWQLRAAVLGPAAGGRRDAVFHLNLSSEDGLASPKSAPAEFDSQQEAEIVRQWEIAAPEGWSLTRESEILQRNQTVVTPDFILRQRGRPHEPIYIELVGYWTPEYLEAKSRQLLAFADRRWILIIPEKNQKRHAVPEGLPILSLKKQFDPAALVELAVTTYGHPRRDTGTR